MVTYVGLASLAAAVAYRARVSLPVRCAAVAVLSVAAYFARAFGFEHAFRW